MQSGLHDGIRWKYWTNGYAEFQGMASDIGLLEMNAAQRRSDYVSNVLKAYSCTRTGRSFGFVWLRLATFESH